MTYSVDDLCKRGAPVAMRLLVTAAWREEKMTYGEIAAHLGAALGVKVSWRHVGHVVGALMHKIRQVEPKAPPINVLAVNKQTRLPGTGVAWFVKRYMPRVNYDRLKPVRKRAALMPVYDDVFSYPHWTRVAKKAFGLTLRGDGRPPESDGKAARLFGRGPAESEEHYRLKHFVAAHPRRFGAPKGAGKGKVEKRIRSFDEIDVLFFTPNELLAVEVKSRRSNGDDIERGVYQCVKYRAVLEAELRTDRAKARVRTALVTECKLTPRVKANARLLGVEVTEITPLARRSNARRAGGRGPA